VVNELLVQLQSFDSPSRSERVRNGWIDLFNRYLPEGRQLRKHAVVPANVLVVGATNRKDDLDPALLRPGRFDRSIYFGLPGRAARADIVAYYLGKKAHSEDLDTPDAVDRVAGMTSGYSPAALERLLDEGLVIALTHGRMAMTMPDLAEAKMLVELGVSDPAVYTVEDRLRVATHEAGHATVAYFLGRSRQLDVLSIVKRRDSLGLLQHSDAEERFTQRRDEMNALLQICMGGLVAEERYFDEVSTGPAGDLSTATTIGAQMIGACGMGDSLVSIAAAGNGLLSGGLVEKVLADKEARAELDTLLKSSRDAARAIVAEHGRVVEALRDALLERDELTGSEITDVIAESLAEMATTP
jgi:ATP-dependent Zn protease